MIGYTDYLRLLPKAELHCHFVATMRVSRLVELARRYDVPLRTEDLDAFLDFEGLGDFLDAFHVANEVLRTPEDIATVAFEGVEDAVRAGGLRYREYFINPDNFRERFDYPELIAALVDGLTRAEQRFGVGFRIIVAVKKDLGADAASALVREVIAHAHPSVVGVGMDYLTPEGTEDPLRFAEAFALAKANGLRLSAHVGETMAASALDVLDAIDGLGVDRIDHGYRIVDDPAALARALESGVSFGCTPVSTRALSGWELAPDHRIAQMIRAGLPVSFSTDDAVFFRTDIGREYTEALPAMGFGPEVAKAVAREGFAAAWCDDAEKSRLLAEFDARILAIDGVLDPSVV